MPFAEEARSRDTGETALVLLTITHAQLTTPIRVVNNQIGQDITSNGNVFTAFPFQVQLISDNEGPPTGQLTVANVDQAIGLALLAIDTPAQARIDLILASAPNTLFRTWQNLELKSPKWNAATLTCTLSQADYFFNEPYGGKRVIPSLFPSLFR